MNTNYEGNNMPLRTWKKIAEYFDASVCTVQKWHKKSPMPIRRTPGGGVLAYADELKLWRSGV